MRSTKETNETAVISNREWKSSAFTAYFGTQERAAELYKVLGHEDEDVSPDDVEFTTLEGVLYLARKNDMAFTVGKKVLVISEHQSTVNLNMPLRNAIYYGRTMEKLIQPQAIYRRKRIMIPTPEFYVFYNGSTPQPLEQTLLLSDAYLTTGSNPMLELQTKVINVNLPAGHEILKKSRSMYEYSWFVHRINQRAGEGLSRDEAIKIAMEDCLAAGIMEDFIQQYGSEVRNMIFGEFDLKVAREVWREEDFEDGFEAGMKAGENQGQHKSQIATAKRMLSMGSFSDETILSAVNITSEELQSLKEDLLQT